jgi:hypothetical protein
MPLSIAFVEDGRVVVVWRMDQCSDDARVLRAAYVTHRTGPARRRATAEPRPCRLAADAACGPV